MTSALDVAARIGRELDAAGIGYAIGGALALGVWGAPRATKDVDIAIFADLDAFNSVADALERAGLMFDRTTAPRDAERVGLFVCRFGRMHVDVFMSRHPHADAMSQRRQQVAHSDGTMMSFLSPEDLCIVKLIYNRDKDVIDLERLFAVRQDLDVGYIRRWITDIAGSSDPRLAVLARLERLLRGS